MNKSPLKFLYSYTKPVFTIVSADKEDKKAAPEERNIYRTKITIEY